MSGVYHLLDYGTIAREEGLDHCAIFVLIAGTSTAAHGLLFRGFWRIVRRQPARVRRIATKS